MSGNAELLWLLVLHLVLTALPGVLASFVAVRRGVHLTTERLRLREFTADDVGPARSTSTATPRSCSFITGGPHDPAARHPSTTSCPRVLCLLPERSPGFGFLGRGS